MDRNRSNRPAPPLRLWKRRNRDRFDLQLASEDNLVCQKKRLGVPACAAELERAEILVPRPFRHIRLRFHPETESVQVVHADVAVTHALDQVVP